MRVLMQFLGYSMLLIGVLLFLYGTLKLSRAEEAGSSVIGKVGDTEIKVNNPQKEIANSAFLYAVILCGAGAVVLYSSRQKK
ncbi:MAG: hypothetical protein HUU01_08285 [Saprospiraceae bacterium]|nr:hypothetical protein [Saprospiraceae bacterium]